MRVVIVEDNVLLAEGLTLILERAGHEMAALAIDAAGFAAAASTHRPDVTIVDVRLPPSFRDEGIRAALAVRRAHPGLPVLVLSQYVESCTPPSCSPGTGAGSVICSRIASAGSRSSLTRWGAWPPAAPCSTPRWAYQLLTRRDNPLSTLSPRERDVLALMAEGHDNATISRRLHIVDSSVNKHVGNIFTKLDLSPADTGHRRVRAVLAYLNESSAR